MKIPDLRSPNSDLRSWFASWRGTHYDPASGRIVFAGRPPAYAIRHEEAHRDQHRERTLLWRLWSLRLPIVHRLVHVLLECDADRRALRLMDACHELDATQLLASRLCMEAAWDTFWHHTR